MQGHFRFPGWPGPAGGAAKAELFRGSGPACRLRRSHMHGHVVSRRGRGRGVPGFRTPAGRGLVAFADAREVLLLRLSVARAGCGR